MGSKQKPVHKDAVGDVALRDGLASSDRRFRLLAEATSAGIFILSDMIIRFANPAATLLTGFTINELIGRPFWELADPKYGEILKSQGLRRIDENIPTRFEIKIVTKSGSERWLDLTISSIEFEGHTNNVVTAFDITERDLAEKTLQNAKIALEREIAERKQVEKDLVAERQRFYDVLETLPAYLILLSPDYHVPFANRFFRERFGESHGRRCYEYLFNRSEECENCESYKVLRTSRPHRWEWLGPDGRNYDIYDFPFTDIDGTTMVMEMGIDITERKQAEAEVRHYQVHLEELVDMRTEELRIANEQLVTEVAERKQAEQALRLSNERLALIAEVTSKLLASDEPQKVVEELCRKVLVHLDCQVFFNYLVDETGQRLRLNACVGIPDKEVKRIAQLDFGAAVCGCVGRDGERIVAENIPETLDPRTDLVRSYGLKAYACHPLIAQEQVIGTLSFGTRTRTHFSEDDLALMKTVTDQVAIAMHHQQSEQALRESEQRFRIVLDHTPVVVSNLDRDLNFTWVYNVQGGFVAEELIGKPVGLSGDEEATRRLREKLRTVVTEGVSAHTEFVSNLPTGTAFYEIHAEPLRDADGQISGVATVSINITERKQAEAELQKERHNLQSIFEVANVGMLLVDKDGSIRRANQVAEQWAARPVLEIYGLQPGDAFSCINALNNSLGCGHTPHCQVCPIRRSFETVLQSGQPVRNVEMESTFTMHGEDRRMWIALSADPVEVDGRRHVILAMNDITDLKEAERLLRQAHDRLEERVRERTMELSITNTQLRTEIEARQKAQAKLEANMQELQLAEEELRQNNAALVATQARLEDEITVRWNAQEELQASLAELQVAEEELRNTNDELLNAQKNLKAERQRFQDLFNFAPDCYLVTDKNGAVQDANQAAISLLGISRSHLLRKPLLVFIAPKDHDLFSRLLLDLDNGDGTYQAELTIRSRRGELIPTAVTVATAEPKPGAHHLRWMLHDISQRKKAEISIRENASRAVALSEIFKSLTGASLNERVVMDIVVKTTAQMFGDGCLIALISEDGKWLDPLAWHHTRPEALELMGDLYKSTRLPAARGLPGQALSTAQPILVQKLDASDELVAASPANREYIDKVGINSLIIAPLLIGGETIGALELRRDKDSQPYTLEDKTTAEILATSISQAIHKARLYQDLQKALQQEQAMRNRLIQVEKFAVVGRMLASITHEINNPLQTIKNCLYIIRQETPVDSQISNLIDMSSSETNRLADLVAQLRQIYRPAVQDQAQEVSLPTLLDEVKTLLKGHLQDKHVEWGVESHEADKVGRLPVRGVANQLKQVFLNISMNAAEAMQPVGGRIVVDLLASADESQVGVRFSDNGPGLSPEAASRLFEPFFTTKEKGLGLGLAISYDIIRQHNGHIDVKSQPGEGAAFTVWLPVKKDET